MATSEAVSALYDYLTENPDGVTIDDIAAHLNSSVAWANRIVRELRLVLGTTSDVNLVCNPMGQGQRWNYLLVGTNEGAEPWARNRARDSESRLRTQRAIWSSVAAATDGRTVEGRKARHAKKAMTRLLEDFAEIEEEAAALQS